MMNSELNNHQTDWLAQTEEINDTEASQVNGGASPVGTSAGLGGLIQQPQGGEGGRGGNGSSPGGQY